MPTTLKPRPARLRYHAVSVVPGVHACPTVMSLKGIRHLSADAPRLPLVGCNRPDNCGCRFLHHSDRREGPRRRIELESRDTPRETDERRRLRGRRDSDYAVE
jgi:hypothetical protein